MLATWRVGEWENEAGIARRLRSKFAGNFPELLGTLPTEEGAIFVYSRFNGINLETLLADHGKKLPISLLLDLGESLARLVAMFHSARVTIGAMDTRYYHLPSLY